MSDDEKFSVQPQLVEPVAAATTTNCVAGTISISHHETRKEEQQQQQKQSKQSVTKKTNRVHRHNDRKEKCERRKRAAGDGKKAAPPISLEMADPFVGEIHQENIDSNMDFSF